MKTSVANPGCLSRIPYPNFSLPDQEDSGSRIRNREFKYFYPHKIARLWSTAVARMMSCDKLIIILINGVWYAVSGFRYRYLFLMRIRKLLNSHNIEKNNK
jgi:hypothetical protein